MTGYHISIGYQSAQDYEEAWEKLKSIVADLCKNPRKIVVEAMCGGMSESTAVEYAEAYRSFSVVEGRTEDSTLVIKEDGTDIRNDYQVMQLAGGGGESRGIKEEMRRAFCRLVMREMHMLGFEINVNVA